MNTILMKHWSTVILCIVLVNVVKPTVAENWPYWCGAFNDGTSRETDLPTKWSKTENVVWRLPLPAPAGTTPVVWEDRIFPTSAERNDLVLLCVSTSGKARWKRTLGSGNRLVRSGESDSTSPSPATDGQYVWTFISTGDLACYDFEGNEVGKTNLADRYGRFDLYFVMASTPLLDGGRIYLQLIHSNTWLVLAFDKATGREIWKHDHKSNAYTEYEHSYASPFLYRDDKQQFLSVHGADYITAHRLEDERETWRCGGLNPRGSCYNPSLRFIASPVAMPGLIVVPSAKNGPVLGLSPDAKGNITDSEEWHHWKRTSNTPDVPSPLIHDRLVYLCRENGDPICMDAETSEEVYKERTHRHRASTGYGNGKIYLAVRDDVVTMVKAGRKFELLFPNDMEEEISASATISNDRLYLRSYDALYAIQAPTMNHSSLVRCNAS